MKHFLYSVILTTIFVVSPMKKSHAMIGGGGASFTIVSALYLAGGAGAFIGGSIGISALKSRVNNKYGKAGLTFVGVLAVMVGVLLMDDDNNLNEFRTINPEFSQMIQESIEEISQKDISTYNSEVEELNAIISNIEVQELQGDGDLSQEDIVNGLKDYDISSSTIKVAGVLSALTIKDM